MFGDDLCVPSCPRLVMFQRHFPVVNLVYKLLYFVERPLARGCETPSRCEDVFLACGAFPLGRGENKITGIILTLMNVQICLHRYTLSRSFHPFPPLCDLLLMTHNTQHTNPCCFPRSFHVRLSSFLSRILTRCAPQTGMQRQLACGATLVAC